MNADWKQIRNYPDGSTVWADPASQWMAFCDAGDLPQDATADVAGSATATAWLTTADDRQSATA